MLIAKAGTYRWTPLETFDRAVCDTCGCEGALDIHTESVICAHEGEHWHDEAQALRDEIHCTASPRLSTLLSLDLEEIVARNLDRAH